MRRTIGIRPRCFCNDIRARYAFLICSFGRELLHKDIAYMQGRELNVKFLIAKNMGARIWFFKHSNGAIKRNFNKSTHDLMQFLAEEESLFRLINALWRVYHSNNIRLSHSFFKLINLITERGFRLKEILSNDRTDIVATQRFLTKYRMRLRTLLLQSTLGGYQKFSNTLSVARITDRMSASLAYSAEQRHTYFKTDTDTLFTNAGLVPTLERIYEGIESNYLFYNASAYQSAKTLYRLTNSLWKIYSGQNLQLSRNFSSLINRITENSRTTKHLYRGNFSTQASLAELVLALRRAFSGNNLHLRNSLISLVNDIRIAGQSRSATSSTNTTTNNNNKIVNNKSANFNATNGLILCHRSWNIALGTPRIEGELSHLHNQSSRLEEIDERRFKHLIDKGLDSVTTKECGVDTEALIKTVLGRLKEEQKEQWRFEKLQRGIF